MKKIPQNLFFLMIFISLSSQAFIKDMLVNKDKSVKKEIIELFAYTTKIILPNTQLETVVPPTQKYWTRQGENRWNDIDLDDDIKISQKIDEVMLQLGLRDSITPKNTEHAFFAISGSTVESMTLRMAYLKDRILAENCTGKVFLLGSSSDCSLYLDGIRVLIKNHPDWFMVNNILPTKITETGVLKFLAENFIQPLGVELEVIDMPDVVLPDQRVRKANTEDQALKLRELIQEASVLFIANNDIGVRQGLVMETVFPQEFLDLAIFHDEYGTEIRDAFRFSKASKIPSILKLDNLTKMLYQILYQNKHKIE